MMANANHRSLKPSCGNCWNCHECGQSAESIPRPNPRRLRQLSRLYLYTNLSLNKILDVLIQRKPSSSPSLSSPLASIDQIPRWENQRNFGSNLDVRNSQGSDSEDPKRKLQALMSSEKPWMKPSSTVSHDQTFRLSGSHQKSSDHNFAKMAEAIPAVISSTDEHSYIPRATLESYWSREMVEKTLEPYGKSQELVEAQELLEALGKETPHYLFESGSKRSMRVLAVLAMLGGVSAAAISSLYRHLQNDPGDKTWTSKNEVRQLLPWEIQTPVQFLRPKTTLALLIGAIGAYGSSTGYIYYRQRYKPRHDMFLMCGVWVGLMAGFLCGFNVQETIFRLLPAFALIGILAVNIFPPDKGEAVMTPEYVA